jgi:(p)ppGpp synthase/HD superfamily hydrolase
MDQKARTSSAMIMQAADFAARQHRTHRRRGDSDAPYLNHVIEVAAFLAQVNSEDKPELVVAGLLHDVVDKTALDMEAIRREFGDAPADIILEASMDRSLDRNVRREQEIARAPGMSPLAKQLKLADKTSSVRMLIHSPPPGWGAEEILFYLDWAEAVARGCAGANLQLDALFREEAAALRAHVQPSIAAAD